MYNNIWYKSIQNPPATPWLDWIESGVKKYEGRVNREDWMKMKIGDLIIFSCGSKIIKTVITNLIYFDNFQSAFRQLGQYLVPIPNISEIQVGDLYSDYFDDNCIKMHGVVAVGLEVIV